MRSCYAIIVVRCYDSYYEKFSNGTVECIDYELPFGIPSSWTWVRLESICYSIIAGGDKPADFVPQNDEKHKIPVVANGVINDGIIGYTRTATAKSNSITIAGRGTIGFPCYRNYDYCPIVRLIVVSQSNLVNALFLYYYLYTLKLDSVGSSIPQLTVPMVKPKLIPIPPINEQNAIVQKISKLCSVIDMIENELK